MKYYIPIIRMFLRNKKIVPLFASVVISILIISCNHKSDSPFKRVVADLNLGESREIKLTDGEIVKLSLLEIKEVRDSVRNAIREAYIKIIIEGKEITLKTGNYNLPVVAGRVQIDCPVIKGYYSNSDYDPWKLKKDARFRLWPKDSPVILPGSFMYPVKGRWFANMTQSGNEPTYVDWGENVGKKDIYYHSAFDIGGAEGMDEIISATDGFVDTINLDEKYINIIDDRGWQLIYGHLDTIDPTIKTGERIKIGQRIGFIGKQGQSGGWVHLHFEMSNKDSVNTWWSEDPYVYLWDSYVRQYNPPVIAVARPHHLVWTGEKVRFNGGKSKSFAGEIVEYEWSFCDGTTTKGMIQEKVYNKPGEYSEILKVRDSGGNIDYDFTVVQVYDRKMTEKVIPAIQSAYHPTLGIKPGDPVVFLVRTFNSAVDNEVWDFGDGSPMVTVKSETVDKEYDTKGNFAETIHSFTKPGHYVVRVERSNEFGYKAISHLHVVVEDK